jgi:thioredoxin:protein disulfide reductase
MKKFGLFIVLALQSAFPQISFPHQQNPFQWSGTLSKDTGVVDSTIFARVKLTINKGNYVYKSRTAIRPVAVPGLKFHKTAYSASVSHVDKISGKKEAVFIDSMIAVVPVAISGRASDPARITLVCSYQGCMETMCFLPATDTVTFLVHVRPAPANASGGHIKSNNHPARALDNRSSSNSMPQSRGGIIALFLAFIGGFLTCLTPCVYPLIPVTISIFGATAAKSRMRAFTLSCFYVAGISVMFSILGFIMASTGKVFGQFLSSPLVIGIVAAIFCIFGISLLGVFNIQLPSSLQNRLATIGGKRASYQKVFFMGLVAGIIAAPCTGPTLGAILTYVATAGNQWFGMLMLLSFSFGLGTPFLLLGTFSSLVVSRPKPGPWMETVKSVLGVIMFIMALYYLREVAPFVNRLFGSTPAYYSGMTLCVLSGIALGALHLSYEGASWKFIVRKTFGIILIVVGSFGIIGSAVLWPDANLHGLSKAEQNNGIAWMTDLSQGLVQARDLKKPVIIDFYADWCLACKELDKETFSDPAIRRELSRFLCIRRDLTKETEATKQIAREYSLRGIPVLEFYSSSGERLFEKRIVGFVPSDRLLDLLHKIP